MRVICVFDIDEDILKNIAPEELIGENFDPLESADLELRNLRIYGFKVIDRVVVSDDTTLSFIPEDKIII